MLWRVGVARVAGICPGAFRHPRPAVAIKLPALDTDCRAAPELSWPRPSGWNTSTRLQHSASVGRRHTSGAPRDWAGAPLSLQGHCGRAARARGPSSTQRRRLRTNLRARTIGRRAQLFHRDLTAPMTRKKKKRGCETTRLAAPRRRPRRNRCCLRQAATCARRDADADLEHLPGASSTAMANGRGLHERRDATLANCARQHTAKDGNVKAGISASRNVHLCRLGAADSFRAEERKQQCRPYLVISALSALVNSSAAIETAALPHHRALDAERRFFVSCEAVR